MIAIIDYEAGNLDSVYKAISFLGKKAIVTSSAVKIKNAQSLILPGVGNFKAGIKVLRQRKLDAVIRGAIASGKRFLGICLGMQLLYERSEEAPSEPGLGIISGAVRKFKTPDLIVPHMGWNSVDIQNKKEPLPLFKRVEDKSYFYFAHSYYCPVGPYSRGVTDYGISFSSCILKDNLCAVQFHPEKSQDKGLTLLRNFCNQRG